MTITDLEMKLMNNIARCEMNQINGAVPESAHDVNTYIWPDERSADLGISEQAFGGVMTSLQRKGLIWVCIDSHDLDDSGMGFEAAGFDAWNADPRANKAAK
jgi:hypothetical protein